MSNVFKKFTTWYFSKKVLPYWVILLADTVIVFLSAIFIYWVSENSLITFEHRQSLFFSALLYSMLSWVPGFSAPIRGYCVSPVLSTF